MRLAGRTAMPVIALLIVAGSATPADAAGWSFAFNQGIAEYSVGSFADDGDSLSLSCAEGGVAPGSVGVHVRRANFQPTKGEPVTFSVGSRQVTMFTDADGFVSYGSVAVAPRFRTLWQMLRSGGTVAVRFGPGVPLTFPLAGAAKLLGPVPCPRNLAK